MNSRIRKRAGQATLNNPKEQSGLKTKGGVLTSCFQVPGQVQVGVHCPIYSLLTRKDYGSSFVHSTVSLGMQLEGKKLTNRDFTTVLALLRGEGFQDDDFR
jgi:hypothetical protein